MLEPDYAVYKREKGVVAAHAHVAARMDFCPALAHEYISGQYELAVGTLCPQSLRITVAAVSGRADAFFMSHD